MRIADDGGVEQDPRRERGPGLGVGAGGEGEGGEAEGQRGAGDQPAVRPMHSMTAVWVEPVRSEASRIQLMMKTW